jgi:outer membrane protein OmpA-like peptidoglycan-associated protein
MRPARCALLAGTMLSVAGLTGLHAQNAPAGPVLLAQAGQPQQPEHKPGEKKPPAAAPHPAAKPPAPAAPQGAPAHPAPQAGEHRPANPPAQPQQRHAEPPAQQRPQEHPPAAAAPAHPQPQNSQAPRQAQPAAPQPGQQHNPPGAQRPAGAPGGAPAAQQERREEHRAPEQKGGVAQPGPAAPGKPAAQQPGGAEHAPAQSLPPANQPPRGPAGAPNQAAQPGTQQPAPGAAAVRRAAPNANANPAAVAPPTQPLSRNQFIAPKGQAPTANINQLHQERHEVREGNRVFIQEPGRTIVQEGNRTIIHHNEVDRFAVDARDIHVDRRGNETVTVVVRPDGVQIINTTDNEGHLLRRVRRGPDGREIVLVDNSFAGARPRDVFVELPPPVIRIPRDRYIVEANAADEAAIYDVLVAPPVEALEHRYTLDEVRYSEPLRARMPRVDLDVTFDTGSWQITPDQAERLSVLADALNRAISRNPGEVFLIEGHTDAVGSDIDNLSLSDRRAETVAVALTEEFHVPAENLVTQGYGKQDLKVQTSGPERANRRVAVRRITPLIDGTADLRPR